MNTSPHQRIAVIGMGSIGNLHASIYQEYEHGNLLAVCDKDRDRADAAARTFGVPAYYSVNELLHLHYHYQ